MATMNVSLPEEMKHWAEKQTQTGRYSNTSDYVRALIRQDQDKSAKIAHMQNLITEGIESGAGQLTMEDIKKSVLKRHAND